MALTDTNIRQTKPAATPIKLTDEKGLHLLINPNGSRYWRLNYRFDGKQKTLALGVYPDVSLKMARAQRDEARQLIANGTDPAELRKAEKVTLSIAKQEDEAAKELERIKASGEPLPGSFRFVALEWAAKRLHDKSPKYQQKVSNQLATYALPFMGDIPVGEVSAPLILSVLQRMEGRGILETMRKVKQHIGQVMDYAVVTGQAAYNPTPSLGRALPPVPKAKHHAAPTEPKDVAPLLRVMAGYKGSPLTKCALTLAPLLFVRPGELRSMEWAHIDFEAAEWRYTTSKTGQEHLVPLATQAIAALRAIQPLTGAGRYVFPGQRTTSRPMSENTVNAALKRLGIDTQNELTGHGFRAMARTMLEEVHNFRPEVVELQLAHAVRDPLGRAYNRTKHLPERKRMMQVWADYLDALREGKNVIHASFGKAA
ncbi:MAG: integrase arm-type DNA-binding domain-containing protein [Pseudomonadota bacterium]